MICCCLRMGREKFRTSRRSTSPTSQRQPLLRKGPRQKVRRQKHLRLQLRELLLPKRSQLRPKQHQHQKRSQLRLKGLQLQQKELRHRKPSQRLPKELQPQLKAHQHRPKAHQHRPKVRQRLRNQGNDIQLRRASRIGGRRYSAVVPRGACES